MGHQIGCGHARSRAELGERARWTALLTSTSGGKERPLRSPGGRTGPAGVGWREGMRRRLGAAGHRDSPPLRLHGSPGERNGMYIDEKDRFYSRLATIPGIRPMPSVGDWILLHVAHPQELARRVNRKLAPGVVSIPRQVDGAVRIQVADPRTNEQLLRTLKEAVVHR